MRLVDYIAAYSDQTFDDMPLNEVDIAALTELSNLEMDDLVPADLTGESWVTLAQVQVWVAKTYQANVRDIWSYISQGRHDVLDALVETERFRQVRLYGFRSLLDQEKGVQFAALMVELPGYKKLVIFRGTDNHIVGWQENFMLAYRKTMPSQKAAGRYLAEVLDQDDQDQVIIAGHSKGGNLALAAAIQQSATDQELIEGIYVLDSPGFYEETFEQVGFRRIQSKVYEYLPEDSLIGIILHTATAPMIIKSGGISLLQHFIQLWEIEGKQFKRVESTTVTSQLSQETLNIWMKWHGPEEIELLLTLLFDALYNTGVLRLTDISEHFRTFINRLYSEARKLEPEERRFMVKAINDLLLIWEDLHQDRLYQVQSRHKPLSLSAEVYLRLNRLNRAQSLASVLIGCVLIMMGVFLFLEPDKDLHIFAVAFLLGTALSGIWDLRHFYQAGRKHLHYGNLLTGCFSILTCIWGIYDYSQGSQQIFPYVLGGWMLGMGLVRAYQFFRLRYEDSPVPIWGSLLSLAGILLGVLLVGHPDFSLYLPDLLALAFIVQGIQMIVSYLIYRKESDLYRFIDQAKHEHMD
ncbi:hypothetical protein CYJ28_05275 [Aerococcus sanguinicola]|uniref:DUF2974 domain-containing protein n=1 Tax=Aerococcus sanguinicola TaxID=119206 RepID=A0A2I1MQX9_9LACT|nr:Mbeg1-like protein [Aerococcus sanguinicola]PKZ22529.1 hypothetical protein CYJ28_05275 [Aerococcus sanguinicola]